MHIVQRHGIAAGCHACLPCSPGMLPPTGRCPRRSWRACQLSPAHPNTLACPANHPPSAPPPPLPLCSAWCLRRSWRARCAGGAARPSWRSAAPRSRSCTSWWKLWPGWRGSGRALRCWPGERCIGASHCCSGSLHLVLGRGRLWLRREKKGCQAAGLAVERVLCIEVPTFSEPSDPSCRVLWLVFQCVPQPHCKVAHNLPLYRDPQPASLPMLPLWPGWTSSGRTRCRPAGRSRTS